MSREPCRVGPFAGTGPDLAERTAAGTVAGVDSWRDMLRDHFVALDVADAAEDRFRGSVRSTLVGHLSAAEVSSAPQTCARTRDLVRREPDTYLQVGLVASGRAVLHQDGREAELAPGRFAVYETDRPFAWHFAGPWTLLVLTWPRHLVDLDADVSRACTARPLGADRLGRTVGRTLAETALCPPTLTYDGGRGLAAELSALVASTAGERVRRDEALSPSAVADLRARVERYIAEHVEDPALAPAHIARAHFVSVRGLHRAFAETGTTVGALIRSHRLEHARRRLVDPQGGALSLTDIAHASGFADLPTFSRSFKLAYQESPSAYRRRTGQPAGA